MSKILGRFALILGVALGLASGLLACSKKSTSPTNPTPTPPPGTSLALRLVSSSLDYPTFLTGAPGDTSRLFVLEKGGTIRVIKSGNLLPTPFLTVAVSTGGELGLLGMAFDPGYATNGRFYISYIDPSGNSQVVRYLVSSDPDVANSTPQKTILTVAQPNEDNHKGGMLAFGPDGYLYASFGDGGGQEDPRATGQTKTDFLGSLLRLDVSGTGPYGIPSDNPFTPPALPELWDYGLRNPWRFSFDRSTNDLYLTDVGQYSYEEINVGTNASGRGKGANYGWSITEGNSCFNPSSGCDKTGLTAPVLVYDHSQGCAVIGGYVYRGTAIQGLQGTYFYGDHCDGWIKSFRLSGGFATQLKDWPSLDTNGNITSFGQDTRGELYVMTVAGNLYKIVAQ
jgi:glucose/arabinose dehydrogenase